MASCVGEEEAFCKDKQSLAAKLPLNYADILLSLLFPHSVDVLLMVSHSLSHLLP